ncbi:MAG TPA: xanthine dehydrogenase family protein subunit M [Thermoanaerobaculia bacterium]
MHPFEYAAPHTKEQAVKLLAAQGSLPLAGGSDLLALIKDGVATPHRLVNLKSVGELHGVHAEAHAGLRIGALTTVAELAADPLVRREQPLLATVAGRAAGPQIRNVATIGGNLCQRPRCWYFRAGYGLLPEQHGKPMVEAGDNRYHAILTHGAARFVLPSTIVPLLVALGARVTVYGPGGVRTLDLSDLYREPQHAGESEHTLAPAEIVTAVTVPPLAGKKAGSYEVRQRETLDWSLATASAALTMDGGKVTQARIVLGQVVPTPWRATAAEELLRGKAIDAKTARAAGEAAVQGARPLSGNAYKVQLTRVAVQRALLSAIGVDFATLDEGG